MKYSRMKIVSQNSNCVKKRTSLLRNWLSAGAEGLEPSTKVLDVNTHNLLFQQHNIVAIFACFIKLFYGEALVGNG